MPQWKFQLLPNEKDVVEKGYRMDSVGEAVEGKVNDALRYPFRFHGVNKLVLCLGRNPRFVDDYNELLGVAQKQCSNFDLRKYVNMNEAQKKDALVHAITESFAWFEANFEDVEFIEKAKKNLRWGA